MRPCVYFINFLGGTGGNLIQHLLIRLLYNKNDYITGKNGNAHSNDFLKLVNVFFTSKFYNRRHDSSDQAHDYIFIINPTKPSIALDHAPPDWEIMFKKFPNGKSILIQCEEDDIEQIVKNLYYKINIIDNWMEFKKENSTFFGHYETPDMVPKEVIDQFAKYNAKNQLVDVRNRMLKYPFHIEDKVPSNFEKQILPLKFKDIYNDPEKILKQLSTFINKPIPDKLLEVYLDYLGRQIK